MGGREKATEKKDLCCRWGEKKVRAPQICPNLGKVRVVVIAVPGKEIKTLLLFILYLKQSLGMDK